MKDYFMTTNFIDILAKLDTIFDRQHEKYGTSWLGFRLPSLTDQIFIKAMRLRTVQENAEMLVTESEEETFSSIFNYSVMYLMKHRFADEFIEEDARDCRNEVVQSLMELYEQKTTDYGEAWRELRVESITDLIYVKLLRIRSQEMSGSAMNNLMEEYQDIALYALFAIFLLKENYSLFESIQASVYTDVPPYTSYTLTWNDTSSLH